MRYATLPLGALLVLGLTAAAPAPPSPQLRHVGPVPDDELLAMGEWDAPPGTFYLNGPQEAEVARFQTPQRLEVCNAIQRRGYALHPNPVSLALSWDAGTGMVAPGNCLLIDARQLRIKAAAAIPDDLVLRGRVRVLD
jgi:hypothetical protein